MLLMLEVWKMGEDERERETGECRGSVRLVALKNSWQTGTLLV